MLFGFRRVLDKRFPQMRELLSGISDPRKRKQYSMEEILQSTIAMFMLHHPSRNEFNNNRREFSFRSWLGRILHIRVPHQDTVAEVLEGIAPTELEQVKRTLVSSLFEQKLFRDFRLFGKYYLIAVDGSGVATYEHRHCPHCLTKVSKSGVTTYFHYVLDAKLVTPDGHAISLAGEWVENESGAFDKQDCERKAFLRLAQTLKRNYPRLPICLLADGLYPSEPVFDICAQYGWEYIFTLKDGMLKSLQSVFDVARQDASKLETSYMDRGWLVSNSYRFVGDVCYHKKYTTNWIHLTEAKVKQDGKNHLQADSATLNRFEYVTSFTPDKEIIIRLITAGRSRWKIENEGFNILKNNGYYLMHKFSRRSYAALKNYHCIMLLAYMINQLVQRTKEVETLLKEHSKQTVRNLWRKFLAYILIVQPPEKEGGHPDIRQTKIRSKPPNRRKRTA
jgi:hypothetical protein